MLHFIQCTCHVEGVDFELTYGEVYSALHVDGDVAAPDGGVARDGSGLSAAQRPRHRHTRREIRRVKVVRVEGVTDGHLEISQSFRCNMISEQ